MRPPVVVAANWKMHKGPDEARGFFGDFQFTPGAGGPTVVVFPPAVSLAAVLDARPPRVEVGVQNIHWEAEGAFTGEISAPLVRAAGATHVLVGHSERRHLFGETDEAVTRKARSALEHGLVPLVCLGETLEERRAGRVEATILRQLDAALDAVEEGTFLLAYEPVWAIGTGETATPADAAAAHGALRSRLRTRIGPRASVVPILYGGSVKAQNAAELMAASDVDGVLVGGASLDPVLFAAIVRAAPTR